MNVKYSAITFLVLLLIISCLSYILLPGYPSSQVGNILVEAHGLLFDVIVFGILFVVAAQLQEKRLLANRNRELIDDYRNWVAEESTHRVVGAVRRLSKSRFGRVDVSSCYLRNAKFEKLFLPGIDFKFANLRAASFVDSNLKNSNFCRADCRGANFGGCNLEGAILCDADFRGAYGLDENILSQVRSLMGARFGPDKKKKLRKALPKLFEVRISDSEAGRHPTTMSFDEESGEVKVRIDD